MLMRSAEKLRAYLIAHAQYTAYAQRYFRWYRETEAGETGEPFGERQLERLKELRSEAERAHEAWWATLLKRIP
jgi:hypothetical protein